MPFNKPRKVCVFTGSRSEYGLMRFLIKAIEEEEALELQLCVTGSHLSELHGRTITEIESDGVEITSILPLSIESDVVNTMADLSAQTLSSMSQEIKRLRPDTVIVLGDRYEAFAAAAAAFLSKVPVLHIHGGETTEGALDNSLRHAITQISSWHFTAAEEYRQKVIRLGQPENRVFNVGPMVIDALAQPIKASREEFENLTGYRFGAKNALVTFHPETLLPDNGVACFRELINALERSDLNILFTHPNADQGFREILFEINTFVSKLVAAIRDAGATEVHMRISSPPVTHPCFYGIDTDTQDQLIAARLTLEEISAHLGVDSLAYLSKEGMVEAAQANAEHFCTACFDGVYPIEMDSSVSGSKLMLEPAGIAKNLRTAKI